MRDSDASRVAEQFRDAAKDAGRVAAERQAARAAECVTDPVTLERVAAALLTQLGGTMPAEPATVPGPPCHMDRRTVTPLAPVQARQP